MNNGIYWGTLNGDNLDESLTVVEMMIKPLARSNKDIYEFPNTQMSIY